MNYRELSIWVDEMAGLTRPDSIYWCIGGHNEKKEMIQNACDSKKDLLKGYFTNRDDISKLLLHNSEEWVSVIEENSFDYNLPIIQIVTEEQVEVRKSMYRLYENSMKGHDVCYTI